MCPPPTSPSQASDSTEVAPETTVPARVTEYTLTIDGVVELPTSVDPRAFFAGLLEHILAYVEAFDGLAGLTMQHAPYTSAADEDDEEGETSAQNG